MKMNMKAQPGQFPKSMKVEDCGDGKKMGAAPSPLGKKGVMPDMTPKKKK